MKTKKNQKSFFEITSLRGDPRGTLKKCVFLPGECLEPRIYAHSISRSKILVPMAGSSDILYELDLDPSMDLSDDPHSYIIDSKWFKITPREASTFPGLCNNHDKIFNEIDNKVPSSDDQKGLFLLAYRTLIYSYWMHLNTLNMFSMLGENIKNSKKSHIVDVCNLRDKAAGFVKEMYKHYTDNNWEVLEHKFITFENHTPTIAANSFQIDTLTYPNGINELLLSPFVTNIFPVSGDIVCVFSYPKVYKKEVKNARSELFAQCEMTKKKYITSEILRVFNVILLSPEYYISLSEKSKQDIRYMFYNAHLSQQGKINSMPKIDWHLF